MNWTIYLFGRGIAFFAGIGFILAGLIALVVAERRLLRMFATLLALAGVIVITLSATPLPYWVYMIGAVTTALWLAAERNASAAWNARRFWLRLVVPAVWLGAATLEIPHQIMPNVIAADRPKLYIIGDSVAAGVGGQKEETWPRQLAHDRFIEVVDLSQMGATAAFALRQAEKLPTQGGLVLLEIGGNDLLGSTSAGAFERDLDLLLAKICAPGRVVLMFELPLPPFCNEFGLIQRRLATNYDVIMIPKRIFISVLSTEGATIDSVHLSMNGHQQMADVVWRIVRPVYDD